MMTDLSLFFLYMNDCDNIRKGFRNKKSNKTVFIYIHKRWDGNGSINERDHKWERSWMRGIMNERDHEWEG